MSRKLLLLLFCSFSFLETFAQNGSILLLKLAEPVLDLKIGEEIGTIRGIRVAFKENDSYIFSKRSSRKVICSESQQYQIKFRDCLSSEYSDFKYVGEMPFLVKPRIVSCNLTISAKKTQVSRKYFYKASGEILVDWEVYNDNVSDKAIKVFHVQATGNYLVEFDSNLMDSLLKESYQQFLYNPESYVFLSKLLSEFKQNRGTKMDSSEVLKIKSVNPVVYQTTKEMFRQVKNSIVTVEHEKGFGSGFIISESGFIITNYHVVEGLEQVNIKFNNGDVKNADVVKLNKYYDLALLKLSEGFYSPIRMGNSDSIGEGDELYAIGTPTSIELGQTITRGIVSGKRVLEEREYIQSDVSINGGNSGGPLLNNRGEVVGVACMKLTGKGIEGLGFGIPINIVLTKLGIILQ